MKRVSFAEVWNRIHNERTVTFAVVSKRTNRALWFTTVIKKTGVIWVYAERPYRYIGWMRSVRGRYVIVRGEDVPDDDISVLRAFQWFMDTVAHPEREKQMVISLSSDCQSCGRPLRPNEENAGVCAYCAKMLGGTV